MVASGSAASICRNAWKKVSPASDFCTVSQRRTHFDIMFCDWPSISWSLNYVIVPFPMWLDCPEKNIFFTNSFFQLIRKSICKKATLVSKNETTLWKYLMPCYSRNVFENGNVWRIFAKTKYLGHFPQEAFGFKKWKRKKFVRTICKN